METKRSLFKAAVSIIALLTAMSLIPSHALADKTITIPLSVDGQTLVVANFTVGKGTEIAYSFNASDVVEFSVMGYYSAGPPGQLSPLFFFFSVINASAKGTFTAPFHGYTYRFSFKNPGMSSSIQVTYDFHEVKPPLSLGILLPLVVIALAMIAFATVVLVTKLRTKRESN
jgi:hypothetical protein